MILNTAGNGTPEQFQGIWKDRANECYLEPQVRRHNMDIFLICYNMKVYCVFSVQSPYWSNSNKYTQYTIFSIQKKKKNEIALDYPKSGVRGFFEGTQEEVQNSCGIRVRNSHGIRVISVQATEDLLYLGLFWKRKTHFIAEIHKIASHICGNFGRLASHLITKYSRISMARTLMACLLRLFWTHSRVPWNKSHSCRFGII